jgi:hypothetical protein
MAEITASTYYTNQVGGTNGDTRSKTYPRVQTPRYIRIRRDLAGSGEPANDWFNIYKLKVGQTIIPGMSYCTHDSGGTTLTLNVGDSTDPDRYASGIVLSGSTGLDWFCDSAIPAGEDTPHVATAATEDVRVTIASTGTPAAASVVFYLAVMDEYAEQ